MEPKRAKTLTPANIRHLLRVTEATSRHPERDVLILLLGFTCGMRVSEIAQIETADVLLPSGRLREEVSLRGAVTKGSKARCVYLSHPKTDAALARYIDWRWKHGKVTALDRSKWQGLMPNVPLILTHKGARYELSVKRRVNYDGVTVEYFAADCLQNYVTRLYRAAGFGRGFSSHSGRRTFASRLVAQGHSIETVRLLLGHVHLDHVAPYLEVAKRARREAIAGLSGVFSDA